jgi:tRNA threonylcarbamoyladenosine biosynthesis protein TsaE
MDINLNLQEKKIYSLNLEQLPLFANAIGVLLQPGDWLFLDGDLGSGKTTLTKEISLYFGVKNFFTSPTFSIIHSEKISQPKNKIHKLLHLDLYRLKSGKELCFIGLEQEFHPQNSVAIFEWPDVLDEQDWEYFFRTTGCAKPTKVLNIKIDGNKESRTYEVSLSHIKF